MKFRTNIAALLILLLSSNAFAWEAVDSEPVSPESNPHTKLCLEMTAPSTPGSRPVFRDTSKKCVELRARLFKQTHHSDTSKQPITGSEAESSQ